MIKISNLDFEKSLDVLGALSVEIADIMQDKELMTAIQKKVIVKDKLSKEQADKLYMTVGISKIVTILPMITKNHKDNVFNIVGIMREEDIETVKKLPLKEVINTFVELSRDKDFLELFKLTQ